MILRLIREPSAQATTLGVLFADHRFFAFTLEDQVREIPGQPVAQWKVAAQTAIPAGRYPVRVSWSPKFQRMLPEVQLVPGFEGIRLHPGNTHTDTAGCILVGLQRAGASVLRSTAACTALVQTLQAAQDRQDPIWLTIEPAPAGKEEAS